MYISILILIYLYMHTNTMVSFFCNPSTPAACSPKTHPAPAPLDPPAPPAALAPLLRRRRVLDSSNFKIYLYVYILISQLAKKNAGRRIQTP